MNSPLSRRASIAFVVLVAALLSSQTQTQPPGPPAQQNQNPTTIIRSTEPLVAPMTGHEEYRLGAGDLISVSIYGDPDLGRDCPIRADGYIFLPLLREKIKAAGKTTEEVQRAIEEA